MWSESIKVIFDLLQQSIIGSAGLGCGFGGGCDGSRASLGLQSRFDAAAGCRFVCGNAAARCANKYEHAVINSASFSYLVVRAMSQVPFVRGSCIIEYARCY